MPYWLISMQQRGYQGVCRQIMLMPDVEARMEWRKKGWTQGLALKRRTLRACLS